MSSLQPPTVQAVLPRRWSRTAGGLVAVLSAFAVGLALVSVLSEQPECTTEICTSNPGGSIALVIGLFVFVAALTVHPKAWAMGPTGAAIGVAVALERRGHDALGEDLGTSLLLLLLAATGPLVFGAAWLRRWAEHRAATAVRASGSQATAYVVGTQVGPQRSGRRRVTIDYTISPHSGAPAFAHRHSRLIEPERVPTPGMASAAWYLPENTSRVVIEPDDTCAGIPQITKTITPTARS